MRLRAGYVQGLTLNIFLVLFFIPLYAFPKTTEVSYQYGEQTTEEEIVSSQDNLDYNYDRYSFRLEGDIFTLGYSDYNRRYEKLAKYNNRIRDANLKLSFIPKEAELYVIKNYFLYGYKDKDYPSFTETLNFIQNRVNTGISFLMKNVWKGGVSFGLNKYNFPNIDTKDRDKYYGQIHLEKYFDDKNVILWARSKVQYTDYSEKDSQGEAVNGGGIKIKFPARIISEISIKGESGERTTIELEEEEDWDYSYWEHEVRFQHDLTARIQLESFGGKSEREYTGARYDSRGDYLGINGKFHLLKGAKRKLYLLAGWQYTEREYLFLTDASYNKHTLEGGARYSLWKDWSLGFGLRSSYYGYEKDIKNKNLYSLSIDLGKYLFNGNAQLDLGYRYQYKDNLHKNDLQQNSLEVRFSVLF